MKGGFPKLCEFIGIPYTYDISQNGRLFYQKLNKAHVSPSFNSYV